MMEEGGEVDCPICGNYFELSKINQHANQCLNVLSENTPISAITRKKKCGDSDFASPPRSQKRLKPNDDCQPRPIYHYQYQDNLSASPSTASCSLSILENKDKLSQLVSPASVTVGNKSSREHDKYRCIKAGDTVKLTPTPSSAAVDNIANKKYSTSICNSTSSTATSRPITTSTTSTSTTSSTKPWGIFFNKSKSKEQSEQNDTTTVTTQSNQTKVNGSVSAVPSSSSTSTSSEALLNLKPDDDNFKPLAEQMRPTSILDYIGQSKAIGENTMLSSLLEAHKIPSMVLWGPPGCGKTTLARIIAKRCKEKSSTRFVQLSATTSGVADVKQAVTQARNEQKMFRRKTVLFIDEIHRFNKLQQDTFLPHVENGTVTLIGATTENPSFHINSALLSRCRVIVLEKLTIDDIRAIVQRALIKLNIGVLVEGAAAAVPVQGDSRAPVMYIQEKAVDVLAGLSDGDARVSLNGLQMAVQAQEADFMLRKELASSRGDCEISGDVENAFTIITTEHIKEGLQQSHLLYDRAGEEHYNAISALHKSIRGSDENAALYWLVRMLEAGEDPMFVARRLLDAATGDVGLADPMALTHAVAVHQGCHAMGMPACGILLAQLTTYLARAPKSCEISSAYEKARKCIQDHQGALPPVPLHLRNAPTRLMQEIGYGKGYKPVGGQYMPDGMTHVNFY